MNNYNPVISEATGIRDERRAGHNTAYRIGTALLNIIGALQSLDSRSEGTEQQISQVITQEIERASAKEQDIANLVGSIRIKSVTPSSTTVREEFGLTDRNGGVIGDTVKIYKDSSIADVRLEGQFLVIDYILADGSGKTVRIDMNDFLSEAEFNDGLEIHDHVVSVKIATDTETQNYLHFEGEGKNRALSLRGIETFMADIEAVRQATFEENEGRRESQDDSRWGIFNRGEAERVKATENIVKANDLYEEQKVKNEEQDAKLSELEGKVDEIVTGGSKELWNSTNADFSYSQADAIYDIVSQNKIKAWHTNSGTTQQLNSIISVDNGEYRMSLSIDDVAKVAKGIVCEEDGVTPLETDGNGNFYITRNVVNGKIGFQLGIKYGQASGFDTAIVISNISVRKVGGTEGKKINNELIKDLSEANLSEELIEEIHKSEQFEGRISDIEDELYGKSEETISVLDEIKASLVDSYIEKNGTIKSPGATWYRSEPYLLHKGEKLSVETGNITNYPRIFTTDKNSVSTGDKLNLIEDSLASEYTATEDLYVVVQGNASKYWTKFDVTKAGQKGLVDDVQGLKDAISGESKFKDKELYLIGDSLFAGEGLIGKKISELLGCKFDNDKNTDASHPLSMGGTNSEMGYPKTTYYRAKNLVDYGGITDGGKNAIVLFENVNDSTITFAPTRKSYICEKIVDIGSLSNLSSVTTADRKLTTAVKVTSTKSGKLLTITQLPTKEGNVTLRVGRGVERHDYGIHLPANPTMQYVIDKILEYEYVLADNQYSTNSVSFASDSDGNAPSVAFTDTDGTGMQCTVSDVSDAKQDLFYYFDGDSISDWTDTSKWVMPVKASGWKSAIEAVKRALPFAKIAIVNMPRLHNITIDNFALPNGGYDENAFKTHCDIEVAPATTRNKAIASLYNMKYIEVANEWGISATNYSDYYYDKNVHPKPEGYYLAGEIIASQIKSWIG